MVDSLIKFKGADLLISTLKDNPKKIARVSKIAITAAITSADKNISKAIVKKHRLSNSFKKSRIFTNVKSLKGSVWIGGQPVRAKDLGVTRKSAKGIRAGRHFFKGGFLATMPSGHKGVFRRKKVTNRWTKGRPRTSSPNLGITDLGVDLKEVDNIVKTQQILANDVLQKVFAREMDR